MVQIHVRNLAGTHAVAAAVAALARPGDVVILAGEMGAGKTAFAQGFGRAIGITEPITSPTFTLVHSYRVGKVMMHHADLYRLSTQHEVADLALAELVEKDGILLVEWGDVVESSFGEHLLVRLDHDPDDEEARGIVVRGHGPSWSRRWERLEVELHRATADPAPDGEA
jgi:tRNA threonylcarbamoyladenosine biosynthesis protein TsaE